MEWKPITLEELSLEISKAESEMNLELFNLWNKVKTTPCKWAEREMGNEGSGFWVIAEYKDLVLYYNDIEDGFNISHFEKHGEIDEYHVEQDELYFAILKLLKL